MSHPCKISLEYKPLDTYPAKKNNIPHFLNQPYIGNVMSHCDHISSIWDVLRINFKFQMKKIFS